MAITFEELISRHEFVLMEAAVIERLRRSGRVDLDPRLEHALLIYSATGRAALTDLYEEYIQVARGAHAPILLCTPTWRACKERLTQAGISRDVNGDAVAFMRTIQAGPATGAGTVLIGGLIGCCHDGYRPDQGLSESEAERFHAWQITRLVEGGVDFLLGATLPALPEATGMARAMARAGVPYIISFVVNRQGAILDGTSLVRCMDCIDTACNPAPVGFMINCSYPSFLHASRQPRRVLSRLVGFQANGSALDHAQLDGAATTQAEDIDAWADLMVELHHRYGVKILGGCCGTGRAHLQAIVEKINAKPDSLPADAR